MAADRRLLLVHAHPDDETTSTGTTMARYAANGAAVTLVSCTLGEEGEIVDPALAHLATDGDDALGRHRLGELADAMAALGVRDFVRLGGDFRYRDSGMAYDDAGRAVARDRVADNALWNADLRQAADLLVPIIRDRRPQVMISDDPYGSYGHPDHVMAHRVATYGALLAATPSYLPEAGPAWRVDRILWTTIADSAMRAMIRRLRQAGDTESFGGYDPDGEAPAPMTSPDDAVAVSIDGSPYWQKKVAAFRAYRSQIAPDSFFFAAETADDAGLMARESFRLAAGVPYPPGGVADDLFAGLG